MSDTSQQQTPSARAPKEQVENAPVRMDRSRSFSTVHGDRTPDDFYAEVHFFQDGLPFNAEGVMMADKINRKDEKLMALAERMQNRANALLAKRIERGDTDERKADPDDGVVNLEYWLRGERRYQWPDVSNRIAAVYKKRVTSIKDAIEFLVDDQRLIQRDHVAKEFQKHLEQG